MSLYRVMPNALWGSWDNAETVVEIETPPVDAGKRVWRVLMDREPIGFVMRRSVTEWDYWLGLQPPNAEQMLAVYGSSSRLIAINTLVETVKARNERKYS